MSSGDVRKRMTKSRIVDATLGSTADIFGRGRHLARTLARHQIDGNNPQSASGGVSKVQLLCEYNPSLLFWVFEKKDEKSGIVDATLGSTADIF